MEFILLEGKPKRNRIEKEDYRMVDTMLQYKFSRKEIAAKFGVTLHQVDNYIKRRK